MIDQGLAVTHLDKAEVSLIPGALVARDELCQAAAAVVDVTTDEQQAKAVRIVQELKAVCKAVEAHRKQLKEPVLQIGRQIDALSGTFLEPVDKEVNRIERQIGAYQAEQRRIREEAERKRQEELRRAEAERQRLEAERVAAEAAAARKADEERQAAEAELFAMAGDDPISPTPAAPTAGPSAEELQAAAEKLRLEEATLNAQKAQALATVPARTVKPRGLAVGDKWVFEVEDLDVLVLARVDLCRVTPNTSAINAEIAKGAREIPGLRIYQETRATVRT